MTTKHTPGPWTIHTDYSAARFTVFDADGNFGDTDYETLNANARLIAAAPFMLQILETIALHAPSLDVQGIRELCDEAIAKARGEN